MSQEDDDFDRALDEALHPGQDEFGELSVFSEQRLAKKKARANDAYLKLCAHVKLFDEQQKAFHADAKEYVEALKDVGEEWLTPRF